MSAYLYDTALIQKLNRWIERTNVHIYGPEQTRQLYQILADTNKDKPIDLPIITIERPNGYQILNVNKRPLTYDGRYIQWHPAGSTWHVNQNPYWKISSGTLGKMWFDYITGLRFFP